MKAVERFDPAFGTPFATFASITMNGEIKRHFRDRSWDVRPPRRLQQTGKQVRRASDDLSQRIGRAPTIAELAEHLDVSREEIVEALSASAAYRADSLDAADADGRGVGRGHLDALGATEPGFEETERTELVNQLIETLSARDAEILRLRFWDELTQEEIAQRVGVSQMHVSRLLRRSVQRLRERKDLHDHAA